MTSPALFRAVSALAYLPTSDFAADYRVLSDELTTRIPELPVTLLPSLANTLGRADVQDPDWVLLHELATVVPDHLVKMEVTGAIAIITALAKFEYYDDRVMA